MKKHKILWYNIGFHCMVLGILGILAIIVFGFLACCTGLPEKYFFIALAAGLACGIFASVCCLKKNCSVFQKRPEE